jgi:hypothetical protein
VKQFTIGITLLLFLASSSLGGLEPLPGDFDAQASLSTFDGDLSPENRAQRRSLKRSQRGRPEDDSSSETAAGRRSVKRSQRGKPSLSSVPASGKPAHAISLIAPVGETALVPHCAKSNVYQQINVYRI